MWLAQHAVLALNVAFRAREVSIAFVSFKQHKGNAPETRILKCSETMPNIGQASGQGPVCVEVRRTSGG